MRLSLIIDCMEMYKDPTAAFDNGQQELAFILMLFVVPPEISGP
jgi:hypothetical protein